MAESLAPAAQFGVVVGTAGVLAWLVAWTMPRFVGVLGRRLGWRVAPEAVKALRLALPAIIVTGGFLLALGQLDQLPERYRNFLANTAQTFLVLVLGVAILQSVEEIVDGAVRRAGDRIELGTQLAPLLKIVGRIAVIVAMVIALLGVWGVDVAPLVASAGLVGAAVAFAAQDTIGNLFGGIGVILDGYYRVGDFLILEDGQRGRVLQIGMRSTQLVTPDDVLITVPNSVMANSRVVNQSAPFRSLRVRLPIGLEYGCDVDHVTQVLTQAALNHPKVSKDPPPSVWLDSFGDSALNFELLVWCPDPQNLGSLESDLNIAMYKALQAAGIGIPFPQRVVHLRGTGGRDERTDGPE